MKVFLPVIFLLSALMVYLMLLRQRQGRRWGHLVYKTLGSLLFVACACASGGLTGWDAPKFWMLLGFLLSLVGDVLLSWPAPGLFVPGGLSFGLAHVAYGVGMALRYGFTPLSLLFFGLIAAGALLYFTRSKQVDISRERPLAVGYILLIAVMVSQALGALTFSLAPAVLFCALGALLFLASDVLLALGRYGKAHPRVDIPNLITYYAAQLLLACSLGL